MVQRQIRWTLKALDDKFEILDYWIQRNKSIMYSEKLDHLFDKALEQVRDFPDLGKKTTYKNIRIKIVRKYLIYYLIEDNFITVVRIWNSNKDPKKFNLQ